jgi:hypothetical protein
MNDIDRFFALLRFSIGTAEECPKMSVAEWKRMYDISKKQALTGITGTALMNVQDVLTDVDNQDMETFEDLIMSWMGDVMKISRRNKKVNHDVVELFANLENKGLQCCLLKGQGNALMYPRPDSRISGDIDVWVRVEDPPQSSQGREKEREGEIDRIIKLVKQEKPDSKATYHHIDAKDINGTPVEVHYRPQFMFGKRHNRALQSYFLEQADYQFGHKVSLDGHKIAMPTPEFNACFQLSHIFNHLFHEGIGLRQIVDYYYVLVTLHKEGNKSLDHNQWESLFQRLGLFGIGRALMWILVHKLGMDESLAIVGQDERRGRFVLNEILTGGNFGKYDARNARYGKSPLGKNLQRLARDIRLVKYFPTESLSEPLFRLRHAWWRYRHN